MIGQKQNVSSKEYEILLEKKSPYYLENLRALAVVKDFLITKKRILYGGMAIDFALKKAGQGGIYSSEVIPDYDFYSPNYVEDSCELANQLVQLGFTNVNVINAIHITTRRVRINDLVVVADIGFIPFDIYNTLPFLEYQELRFIHPNIQKIDQLKACSFLYDDPPMESVNNRLKKDMTRFKMLEETYPIQSNIKANKLEKVSLSEDLNSNSIIREHYVLSDYISDEFMETWKDQVWGGKLQYILLYNAFIEFANDQKKQNVDTNILHPDKVDLPIIIYSNHPKKLLATLKLKYDVKCQKKNDIAEFITTRYFIEYQENSGGFGTKSNNSKAKAFSGNKVDIIIYSFRHKLLSITQYSHEKNYITSVYVSLMSILLSMYFEIPDQKFLDYFCSIKNMIDIVEGSGSEMLEKYPQFYLSTDFTGDDNINLSELKWIKQLYKPEVQVIPSSYYPLLENGSISKTCPSMIWNKYFTRQGQIGECFKCDNSN